MGDQYQPLQFQSLETGITYFRPHQDLPEVTEGDPAVNVMTDLSKVTAFTAELLTPLSKALNMMVKAKVRLLLVRDHDGAVRGLITSRDLQGEKPKKILEKSYLTMDELVVRDIMTLSNKLDVLKMEDVQKASVGDIIATLKEVGRQHAMVLDTDPSTGKPAIRGLFSLSQIARQLGLEIDPAQQATTFAQIEEALQKRNSGAA